LPRKSIAIKNIKGTTEIEMVRRVLEDVTEMTVIGLFLGMIWMWATALAPIAGA
jgi:hypothetical protein